MIERDDQSGELALVMSGGGARSAYQVGVLRCLARHRPALQVPIITGVSAGAINAVYLASHQGSFAEKTAGLASLWGALTIDQVFRVDTGSIASHVIRWGSRLVSGGSSAAPSVRGLVDTTPLGEVIARECNATGGEVPGIAANLQAGRLRAAAVTASSYSTGQSITWAQGRRTAGYERAHRRCVDTELGVRHVMASAALPLFFPAVEVDGAWFGDGGIRLTAPLSPAVHLGADKILAISIRQEKTPDEADEPTVDGYPPVAQVVGSLLNAMFLDLFDADVLLMERINLLLEKLPVEQRGELRPIRMLMLRPSLDLGQLANEYETSFPRPLRFMTRGLGTGETRSNDMLSLIMFQPDYLTRLLELGEADAEARLDELLAFLDAED